MLLCLPLSSTWSSHRLYLPGHTQERHTQARGTYDREHRNHNGTTSEISTASLNYLVFDSAPLNSNVCRKGDATWCSPFHCVWGSHNHHLLIPVDAVSDYQMRSSMCVNMGCYILYIETMGHWLTSGSGGTQLVPSQRNEWIIPLVRSDITLLFSLCFCVYPSHR